MAGVEIRRVGGGGLVDYEQALAMQRAVHAAVVAGTAPDTVLLLEHPPTYTAGRRTQADERPADGTPVVEVDRGGKITWHGPGQLVGYPILRLPVPVDGVGHVRRTEAVLIAVCDALGVPGGRVEGRSGVWVGADVEPGTPGSAPGTGPARKVAAIGVRVARQVTMHGFALNVCNDLGAFSGFVPCGISDAGVTSLSAELGRHVGVAEVEPVVRAMLPLLEPAPAARRLERSAPVHA